jgi:formate dehydrogenase iron-sulfur subunit
LYVLKDATKPEEYGLPRDPAIPLSVALWKGPVKWLGSLALAGTVFSAMFHYLRFGPKKDDEDHAA